jgi:glucuronoarabinoxylan endo-1,4-beta-xylanase
MRIFTLLGFCPLLILASCGANSGGGLADAGADAAGDSALRDVGRDGDRADTSLHRDSAVPDASVRTDTGSAETGSVETGSADTGSADTGLVDSGSPDAAGHDASTVCAPGGTAGPNAVEVDVCTTEQPIDGFGAADTWAGPLTATQVTLFFDPVNGIGLSLLRIGIDVNGTPLGSGAYPDAIAAAKFGVKVWGAPWTPPAADKSNGSEDNGGTLNASAYDSWATVLAGFPATFKQNTNGLDLYGISAQNEPDFTASYASCIYSSAQMVAFVKVLGPKLAALNPPVNLLAAEPDAWNNLWSGDSYGTAILADTAASSAVTIFAAHDYGNDTDSVTTRPAPPAGVKQHIWETEVSDETAADVDIGHGIEVATWVYAALTTGGASAWHYWWLINANTDGEGLLLQGGSTTNPPKRLYTVGNYSKFIRPGFVRVGTAGATPAGGALVSAFENPADGTVVVVAINPGTAAATLPIFVSGGKTLTQVTPYVTSATENLAAQAAIAVTNANFTATLAAQTVTTFVSN